MTFERDQILEALDALADDLDDHGLTGELFVVGGGAMALSYSNDRATRDLDAVFEPKMRVYEAAKRVAQRLGLEEDWLNDAMKGFLHGHDRDATVLFERPGLAVRIASPRYLFIMKALAARESDIDDLRILYALVGFISAGEACEAVQDAYPHRTIRVMTKYLIEGIAAEAEAERHK